MVNTESYRDNIHFYLGKVAADKENDSRFIKVILPEVQPNNRNVHATEQSVDVGTDSNNGKQTGNITISNFITAEYYGSTNSGFPPDVRENEQVLVIQYGDTNKYYWQSMGLDDNLRRTERTRLQVGATLDNNASLDDSNVYALELNTRTDQAIRLWTTTANGEQHAYNFSIDAKNSRVFLGDDYGNSVTIDSNKPRITVVNQAKSLIDLNNEDITIYCNNNINMVAKNGTCKISSGDNMELYTKAEMKLTSDSNMTQTSKAKYDLTSMADMTQISNASFTQTSTGPMNITGSGSLTLMTGGMYSLTFGAGGVSNGGGGEMHFKDTIVYFE